MKLSTFFYSSMVAVLCSVGLASAAQPARSDVAALRDAQDRVARFADTTKGGVKGRLLLDKQRIQGLIDDLERGRSVDPADIDRVIQRSTNPAQP